MRYLLLFFSAWLLAGCAGGAELSQALSQPLDSTVQQHLAHQLHAGKVKFKGHITLQVGTGNVNAPKAQGPVAAGASQAQDYTKAGQHGGALATAPGASAGATTRTGVPPWALVAGSVLLLLAGVCLLAYRLRNWLFQLKN